MILTLKVLEQNDPLKMDYYRHSIANGKTAGVILYDPTSHHADAATACNMGSSNIGPNHVKMLIV